MITRVVLSARAQKALRKAPPQVVTKLKLWVDAVNKEGLETVRIVPGFHDEPLHGSRKGQRSIRLNRSYRAIYEIRRDGALKFVSVEEVSKHDY